MAENEIARIGSCAASNLFDRCMYVILLDTSIVIVREVKHRAMLGVCIYMIGICNSHRQVPHTAI